MKITLGMTSVVSGSTPEPIQLFGEYREKVKMMTIAETEWIRHDITKIIFFNLVLFIEYQYVAKKYAISYCLSIDEVSYSKMRCSINLTTGMAIFRGLNLESNEELEKITIYGQALVNNVGLVIINRKSEY